ncbi:hypothetical protein AMELA_G00177820 [Ameiurus melas]|uniref:Uncharacterized protein n=1 Tax=Ameiurus melas TaxID=219545 RepID=A0A7J6ABH0_AMEME|nr:hypothetical protein AMELA_G00177820 [Ameiurus melas]
MLDVANELFDDFSDKDKKIKRIKDMPPSVRTVHDRTIMMANQIEATQVKDLNAAPFLGSCSQDFPSRGLRHTGANTPRALGEPAAEGCTPCEGLSTTGVPDSNPEPLRPSPPDQTQRRDRRRLHRAERPCSFIQSQREMKFH